jgi:hypothetical protein
MEVREIPDNEGSRDFRDSLKAYQAGDQVVLDEQDHAAQDEGTNEGMPEPKVIAKDDLDKFEADVLAFNDAEGEKD